MKKIMSIMFLIIFSFFLFVNNTKANSAEPPMVWILVPGTYERAEGVLIIDSRVVPGYVTSSKMETYIRFHYSSIPDFDHQKKIDGRNAKFVITLDNNQYTISSDIRGYGYNDLYTLDLDTMTLIEGKTLERNAFLISLRLFSTLILEGFVFFLMGYRQRRTWMLFLLVNLVTQGGLNILLSSGSPANYGIIFSLMVYEILIIIFEGTTLLLSVREGKKLKLFLTILVANVLSLFLGGWFIMNLPL
jgi:hypothetical protein